MKSFLPPIPEHNMDMWSVDNFKTYSKGTFHVPCNTCNKRCTFLVGTPGAASVTCDCRGTTAAVAVWATVSKVYIAEPCVSENKIYISLLAITTTEPLDANSLNCVPFNAAIEPRTFHACLMLMYFLVNAHLSSQIRHQISHQCTHAALSTQFCWHRMC